MNGTRPLKYGEDQFLAKALDYIKSTYNQHYVDDRQTQLIDLFDSDMDINELIGFLRINSVKYLKRFGKKEGYNERDLLKAIHYTTLLAHFSKLLPPTNITGVLTQPLSVQFTQDTDTEAVGKIVQFPGNKIAKAA